MGDPARVWSLTLDDEQTHWKSLTRGDFVHDANVKLDNELAAITAPFPETPLSIVEIGCGWGRLTEEIAIMYPQAKVLGIDINQKLLPENGAARYRCTHSLGAVRNADAIYSVTVFQHLPHVHQMGYITGAYKALNPGGVLRIQFIDDDEDSFLNHHTTSDVMKTRFSNAGFSASVEWRLAHPMWAWITGVK